MKNKKIDSDKLKIYIFCFLFILFIISFFIDSLYIKLILLGIVYVGAGFKVIKNTFKNIKNLDFFDENFLMFIATIGAIAIKYYTEATAVMLFYFLGEILEDYVIDNSKKNIKDIFKIKPEKAVLIKNGEEKEVQCEEVKINDIIIVRPGEKIPLDGTIIEGKSSLNQALLTGESIPKYVKENDYVLSGAINETGVLKIKVRKTSKESTVQRILEKLKDSLEKKAETEKFFTKFAKIYTPIIVFLSLLIFLIPVFIFKQPLNIWLYRALIILVISCPCALVVSIPLGFIAGLGKAAKEGIIIKGSQYLEALNNIKYFFFDKTGTLTQGIFQVQEIVPFNNTKIKDLIHFAALAEYGSKHPISNAVLNFYEKKLKNVEYEFYKEIAGQGIHCKVNNNEIVVGNDKLLHKLNIEHTNCNEEGTIVYVCVNNKYLGFIRVADSLRKNVKETIQHLNKSGITTIMLTGDKKENAEKIFNMLSLKKYFYELLPEEKLEKIKEEQNNLAKNKKIMFLGDGINDALSIAYADIGAAVGESKVDISLEVADIIFFSNDFSKIKKAFSIASLTNKIVWQNIICSLGVKFGFIIFSIFGFITMWEAIFADVGVAVLAILNSSRILKSDLNR